MLPAAAGGRSAIARLLLLGGGRAAAAVLGFGAAALLARALPPEALGAWALALAVQGYALHLGELGLRSVATAAAGREPDRVRALLARYLPLRLSISAAVLAAVAVGAGLLAPAQAPVVVLAAASILAAALQLDWVALADDRPALASALLLARPAAFLALLAAAPSLAGTGTVALFFLASWSLAAVVSWSALVGRPHRAQSAARDATAMPAASMLRAGVPLCAVTLLNQTLLSADLLLAGACLGAAAAGDYFLAAQVATAGLVLANAAGQSALARLAGLPPASPAFASALAAEARVLLGCGGLLTLALLALGPPLLPILFGDAHAAAGTALLALLPWFLLQHPTTLLQGALAAAGQGDRVLRDNLTMLAVLVPALAAAALLSGSLPAFALARAAGEAARLAALLLALPPETRRAGLEALRPTPDRLPARPFAARFARPGGTPATEAAACPAPRSCSPP